MNSRLTLPPSRVQGMNCIANTPCYYTNNGLPTKPPTTPPTKPPGISGEVVETDDPQKRYCGHDWQDVTESCLTATPCPLGFAEGVCPQGEFVNTQSCLLLTCPAQRCSFDGRYEVHFQHAVRRRGSSRLPEAKAGELWQRQRLGYGAGSATGSESAEWTDEQAATDESACRLGRSREEIL